MRRSEYWPLNGRGRGFVSLPGWLLTAGLAWAQVAPPEVVAAGETLVGTWEAGGQVMAFKGIPFAAPPVGERRWQPPAPHRPRAGRIDAGQFAPACVQDTYNIDWYRRVGAAFGAEPWFFTQPRVSEDCLYLNVWTTALGPGSKQPVMVWIYGGSNRAGWSFEPNYHGAGLSGRGVVVVTIAYRVGVMGFFGHPELDEEAPLNFGLRDQIAALEWVRESIAAFGGDPDNVTVFGESAGASNIGYLVNSPAAAPLFQRAISQSGGFQLQYDLHRGDLVELGSKLGEFLGQPGLEALKRVPADVVFEAALSATPGGPWRPVVDGETVLASPAKAYRSEGIRHDLMIGSNADEQYMYLPPDDQDLPASLADFPEAVRASLQAIVAAHGGTRLAYDRAITLAEMVCPGYLMAASAAGSGRHAWVYRFVRQRPGPGGEALRAYHGAEIPYVFGTHDPWLPVNEADAELTDEMMSYWVQFAATGNPNREGLPSWPAFLASDPRMMVLDDESRAASADQLAECMSIAGRLYPGWTDTASP